jgi:hypothetical protein
MAKRVREEGRDEEAEADPVSPAAEDAATQVQAPEDRRLLRSRYLAVKSQINGTGLILSARVRACGGSSVAVLGFFLGCRFRAPFAVG